MSLIGAHQFLNYAYNTAKYGRQAAKKFDDTFVSRVNKLAKKGKTMLDGNAPINQIKGMGNMAEAFTSPLDFAGRVYRGEGITNSFKSAYMKDALDEAGNIVKDEAGNVVKSMDWGNVAGTAIAGSLGLGVVGGLTHDTAGNVDIAGIPGI